MEAMARSPLGSALNTRVESAIAARSAIVHDESNAETLLILENILCMLG